ncbi:DUF6894 family protein [Methylobacterium sp. C33D]
MPLYFSDTFDHVDTFDDKGTVLPDRAALRCLLRTALTKILRDEREERGVNQFAASARDESGQRVMSAQINITITDQWASALDAKRWPKSHASAFGSSE